MNQQKNALLFLTLGLFLIVLFWLAGNEMMSGYVLDLGSLYAPAPLYSRAMLWWTLLGGLSASMIAIGVAKSVSVKTIGPTLQSYWLAASDTRWLIYSCTIALIIPIFIRFIILQEQAVTDDEACYNFASDLLMQGKLYASSHPEKLFFDRFFMINDGKYYAQYPLGWPALLSLGKYLSVGYYINAFYSALTLPAIYLSTKKLTNRSWARIVVLLYLTSPFIQIVAATGLSHTTCMMSLAWMTLAVLRTREKSPKWWHHFFVALFFSIAFFIRPTSSLGIGGPLLILWLLNLPKVEKKQRVKAIVAFLVPSIFIGTIYLLVNHFQTGSFYTIAYQRYLSYSIENDYRFSVFLKSENYKLANFHFAGLSHALSNMASAMLRMNFAFLGWPISLFFVLFAWGNKGTRLLWSMLGTYLMVHFFILDAGIDAFGPMHYFEMSLPLLILSVIGIKKTTTVLQSDFHATNKSLTFIKLLPVTLAFAMILVSLAGYTQIRIAALSRISNDVRAPQDFIKKSKIKNAVVFYDKGFSVPCKSLPTRYFIFMPPMNDPEMKNNIIWANRLSTQKNIELMKYFPDRKAYYWIKGPNCAYGLIPFTAQIPKK